MAENKSENWRDLCNAALEAKHPDELFTDRSPTEEGPKTGGAGST
jgi:hypothetical protein